MTVTSPPLVITSAGPQITPPADLNQLIITLAGQIQSGLTTNLPGTLIEDIASTDTGALIAIDQARADLINSVSPLTANPWLLTQLGVLTGIPIGAGSNTSVSVVFSGPPGYVVTKGFVVGDGTYQYVITVGTIIGMGGQSPAVLAVATQAGSWAVSTGSVVNTVTSVPTTLNPTLTVTNPFPGTPSTSAPSEEVYRSLVTQGFMNTAQGVPAMCKAFLAQVPGVNPQLVSIKQLNGGWEVIVGGSGDPYLIGNAIMSSFGDITALQPSRMLVTGITNANPGVVTVNLNHGYASGQVVNITGVTGMGGINNVALTATVISPTSFSIGISTTSSGTYTGGGIVTPNFRNTSVNLYQFPDIYTVPYVVPPAQTAAMLVTWNTSAPNFTGAPTVNATSRAALVNYINALPGGAPINILDMQDVFRNSVSSFLTPSQITRLAFAISINGIGVQPPAGTQVVIGDPEGYFTTTPAQITVQQG